MDHPTRDELLRHVLWMDDRSVQGWIEDHLAVCSRCRAVHEGMGPGIERGLEDEPEGSSIPGYEAYLARIDAEIERAGLGPEDRRLAAAFAIALYRRSVAGQVAADARAVVAEAIGILEAATGRRREWRKDR